MISRVGFERCIMDGERFWLLFFHCLLRIQSGHWIAISFLCFPSSLLREVYRDGAFFHWAYIDVFP